MNDFHWIPFIAGCGNFLLSAFILSRAPWSRLHQVFAAMCLLVSVWNFGVYGLHVVGQSLALIVVRLTWTGNVFLPVLITQLSYLISGAVISRRWLSCGYAVAVVAAALVHTPSGIVDVRWINGAWFAIGGPVLVFFTLVMIPAAMLASTVVLVKKTRSGDAEAKARCRAILAVNWVLCFFGLNDMMPALGVDRYPFIGGAIHPWGSLAGCFYSLFAVYCVLNDRLVWVRLVIGERLAGWVRFAFFMAVVFLLLLVVKILVPGAMSFPGMAWSLVACALAVAVCVRFFPRLLGAATEGAQRRFLADAFDYREKLEGFIERLAWTGSLAKMTEETTRMAVDNLGCGVSAMMVGGRPGVHAGVGFACDRRGPAAWDGAALLDLLAQGDVGADGPITMERLGRDAKKVCGLSELKWVFPIRMSGGRIVGALALGANLSRPFLQSDFLAVERLVRSLAFQIERFYNAEAEQLRAANDAKDRFLASINHEMRNPLNGIMGIVEMCTLADLPPRERFLLTNLKVCAERLGATIDEVLDFASVDAGAVTLRENEVSLRELVVSTCSIYPHSRVVVAPLPADDLWVRCDSGKLRQILCNFIDNALKYGEPPMARIELSTTQGNDGSVEAAISVFSGGEPLSVQEAERIFTPFVRGGRAREAEAGGLGLGLSLSRRVAEAMGGSIIAVGEADGNRFTVTCRLRRVEKGGDSKADVAQGLRILAVEDEDYNRLVLGYHLGALGAEIVWAGDGESAVARLSESCFDLVIMDWFLPGISGRELIEKMRAVARAGMPPIIVVSAFSTLAKREECLAAGAAMFVSKPVSREKLRVALAETGRDGRLRGESPGFTLAEGEGCGLPVSLTDALRESIVGDLKELVDLWEASAHGVAKASHRVRGKLALLGPHPLLDELAALERLPDTERIPDTARWERLKKQIISEIAMRV